MPARRGLADNKYEVWDSVANAGKQHGVFGLKNEIRLYKNWVKGLQTLIFGRAPEKRCLNNAGSVETGMVRGVFRW